MSCTKLTSTEIEHLTRILRLPPDADPAAYATRVAALLSSSLLPSHLKRPSFFSRLVPSSRSTTVDTPPLCVIHRRLNAYTIHSLFKRLSLEVGRNLNSLVLQCRLLSAQQRALVAQLRVLHALWTPPDDYVKTFLTSPPDGDKWRFQHNGCKACILARIGGDQDVLLDLTTVLLSRTKSAGRHRDDAEVPTLLRFVEAWLDGLRVGDGILEKSWMEAQALKVVRKRIWKERARHSYTRSRDPELELEAEPQSSRVTDVGDLPDLDAAAKGSEVGITGSDMENDIIDQYAASSSTLHVTSLPTGPETTDVKRQSSDISGTTLMYPNPSYRLAEEQARSYQNLLATPPLQCRSARNLESGAERERSHI